MRVWEGPNILDHSGSPGAPNEGSLMLASCPGHGPGKRSTFYLPNSPSISCGILPSLHFLLSSFYFLFFCFFEIVKILFPAWICLLAIYKSYVPPRGGLFFRQRREHFVFCVFLLNLNATDVWLDPGFGRCHHVYGAMVVVRILCFARNKKANSNRLKCYGELLAQVTQMSKDGKASGTVWSGTCHSLLSMRAGFRLLYPPL